MDAVHVGMERFLIQRIFLGMIELVADGKRDLDGDGWPVLWQICPINVTNKIF
jgi:hypothetical protein